MAVANTLWAYATMGRAPSAGVMRGLEGRAEAVAPTMQAQSVANTLWAYATMGRAPSAGVMRGLEGRAEAVASTKELAKGPPLSLTLSHSDSPSISLLASDCHIVLSIKNN